MKPFKPSHARTSKKLKGLNPLLNAWIQVVKDFCKADSYEDNPWWYNERASLSTLAGAAWRLQNWSALEEYSTTKRGRIPGRRIEDGKVVRGRCDLYVAHATTSFALEAKQAWQPIGSRARKNHITTALSRAVRDAGNLTADEANHRLGVVFAAPYLPVSEVSQKAATGISIDRRMIREKFAKWIQELDLTGFDAYAYVFVDRCQDYVGEGSIERVFPGVFLAIKRCKTGTKRRPLIK